MFGALWNFLFQHSNVWNPLYKPHKEKPNLEGLEYQKKIANVLELLDKGKRPPRDKYGREMRPKEKWTSQHSNLNQGCVDLQ